MKFALRDRRIRENLPCENRVKWTFSSYFFHNRGSQNQKTLLAMLKELLHSILAQNLFLVRFVLPCYEELITEQRTSRPSWDIRNLRKAILEILTQSSHMANLCLFLDALDEHAGENEQLVALIKEMAAAGEVNYQCVRVKICLASRPWDIFIKHFGQCPQFAMHEHTHHDIELYTTARIRKAAYTSEPSPAEAELVAQIVREASGVFIWVRLVMDQVAQELIDGTPFPILKQQVSRLPSELEELYRLTVERIRPGYHAETWIMFQAILYALRPLPLPALIALTDTNVRLLGFGQNASSLKELDHPTRLSSTEEQLRRLNSRSGGLLEAVITLPHLHRDTDSLTMNILSDSMSYRVQFIHQTIKDSLVRHGTGLGFLVGKNGLAKFVYDASGFEFMLNACCLKAEWSRKIRFDTFNYAKLAEQAADSDASRLNKIAESTSIAMEHFMVDDGSKDRGGSLTLNESLFDDNPDLALEWDKL